MAERTDPQEIDLIVGLGNPGPQYEATRHNAGFIVVDTLADDLGVSYWKSDSGASVATARIEGRTVLLAKPMSYMNTSGGPVSKLLRAHGIDPAAMLVVHDELDLPEGEVKLKFGGGHAGHNGLRSIFEKTGIRDFTRLRVGIDRPPGRMSVSDYVLSVPRGESMEAFGHACATAADIAALVLERGVDHAMKVCNTR